MGKSTVFPCLVFFFFFAEHDPAPIFFDQKVQELLKRVTGMDFDKIFRSRLNEKELEVPKYEFLTDSELNEVSCKVWRQEKLRMILRYFHGG